mgnify:CR=1 FL=1
MANEDTTDTARLTLRGHHLGCVLAGFGEPTDHPTVPKAVEWLREHPTGLLKGGVGPDDICLPCPQWDGTTCLRGFEEMNKGKDTRFVALLGMRRGEELPAREVYERLCARATLEFFEDVCPRCSPAKCAAAASQGVPF